MSYKKFNLDEDVSTNSYLLTEELRVSQFHITGGYYNLPNDNIKYPHHYTENNVSGSYFIEVFDKNFTDPSAIKLLTMTYGYTSSSIYYSGSGFVGTEQSAKLKMYRMFAKRLLGDEDRKFIIGNKELNEAIFLSLPRNQYRDGILPYSSVVYFVSGTLPASVNSITNFSNTQAVADAITAYPTVKIEKEFSGRFSTLIHIFSSNGFKSQEPSGLTFFEAGVYVLDPSIRRGLWSGSFEYDVLAKGVSGSSYRDMLNGVRSTIAAVYYKNYSRVQSTYFKCIANPSEFNYSSNPSFVSPDGQIITTVSSSSPNTYISQVGLLGPNNELIAVGKLVKPVKKNPSLGVQITVRLDH